MEIVKFIDGDLLTIANIVNCDKNKGQRDHFTWSLAPKTDETLFNIENTDIDLHVHQNVANDRFYIHWIDLMNRFAITSRKTEDVKQEGDIMLDEWSVKCANMHRLCYGKKITPISRIWTGLGWLPLSVFTCFAFLKKEKQ